MIRTSFLPLATLLLAGCGAQGEPEATAEKAAAPSVANTVLLPSQPERPHQGPEKIGEFTFRFDHERLVKVGASIALPPDWTSNVLGVKLLAPERAAMLEKADCSYGASGSVSRCNADMEAGLAFAALQVPFESLRADLPADQLKPLALAGGQGVAWSIGAEGEGADYMLIPAREGSLLIVRQFRESGNPDAAAVSEALASLRTAS